MATVGDRQEGKGTTVRLMIFEVGWPVRVTRKPRKTQLKRWRMRNSLMPSGLHENSACILYGRITR